MISVKFNAVKGNAFFLHLYVETGVKAIPSEKVRITAKKYILHSYFPLEGGKICEEKTEPQRCEGMTVKRDERQG